MPIGEVVAEVLADMCLDPGPPIHKLCTDLQAKVLILHMIYFISNMIASYCDSFFCTDICEKVTNLYYVTEGSKFCVSHATIQVKMFCFVLFLENVF